MTLLDSLHITMSLKVIGIHLQSYTQSPINLRPTSLSPTVSQILLVIYDNLKRSRDFERIPFRG